MISGFFLLFSAIVMLNVISRNKKRGDRSAENWVPPSITPDENCSHDHHLRGRVDVLLANAPYVPTEEIRIMPQEAREYEPQVALDGGGDGLDVQRRLIAGAPLWLAQAGTLLTETVWNMR